MINPTQRARIGLLNYHGVPVREIARQLRLSVRAVRRVIHARRVDPCAGALGDSRDVVQTTREERR